MIQRESSREHGHLFCPNGSMSFSRRAPLQTNGFSAIEYLFNPSQIFPACSSRSSAALVCKWRFSQDGLEAA